MEFIDSPRGSATSHRSRSSGSDEPLPSIEGFGRRLSPKALGKQRAVEEEDEPSESDDELALKPVSRPASPPPPRPRTDVRPPAVIARRVSLSPPPLEGGHRSLRQRKAIQLNPYKLEQMRYAVTCVRNDWEDAVVAPVRTEELSERDQRKRKEQLQRDGAYDHEGWLELEAGVKHREDPDDQRHRAGSLSSEDGGGPAPRRKKQRTGKMVSVFCAREDSD